MDWIFKRAGKSKLNLRLSPTKLKTKNGIEQFYLMMKKFDPWQEELNRVILMAEQSGILLKWGSKDIEQPKNPFSVTETDLESKAVELQILKSLFIFVLGTHFWLKRQPYK